MVLVIPCPCGCLKGRPPRKIPVFPESTLKKIQGPIPGLIFPPKKEKRTECICNVMNEFTQRVFNFDQELRMFSEPNIACRCAARPKARKHKRNPLMIGFISNGRSCPCLRRPPDARPGCPCDRDVIKIKIKIKKSHKNKTKINKNKTKINKNKTKINKNDLKINTKIIKIQK